VWRRRDEALTRSIPRDAAWNAPEVRSPSLATKAARVSHVRPLVSSAHGNDFHIFVYLKDLLDRLLADETSYDVLRSNA
jgi:hypothetical protein